jgi:hypothetical protein
MSNTSIPIQAKPKPGLVSELQRAKGEGGERYIRWALHELFSKRSTVWMVDILICGYPTGAADREKDISEGVRAALSAVQDILLCGRLKKVRCSEEVERTAPTITAASAIPDVTMRIIRLCPYSAYVLMMSSAGCAIRTEPTAKQAPDTPATKICARMEKY